MVVDAFAEAMSLPKVVIVGGGPGNPFGVLHSYTAQCLAWHWEGCSWRVHINMCISAGGVNAAKALSGVADVTLVDGCASVTPQLSRSRQIGGVRGMHVQIIQVETEFTTANKEAPVTKLRRGYRTRAEICHGNHNPFRHSHLQLWTRKPTILVTESPLMTHERSPIFTHSVWSDLDTSTQLTAQDAAFLRNIGHARKGPNSRERSPMHRSRHLTPLVHNLACSQSCAPIAHHMRGRLVLLPDSPTPAVLRAGRGSSRSTGALSEPSPTHPSTRCIHTTPFQARLPSKQHRPWNAEPKLRAIQSVRGSILSAARTTLDLCVSLPTIVSSFSIVMTIGAHELYAFPGTCPPLPSTIRGPRPECELGVLPGIGKVVIAHVTAVSLAAVSLDDGQSLPYDFLVLAPGSTYPDPAIKAFAGTLSTRQAAIQVCLGLRSKLQWIITKPEATQSDALYHREQGEELKPSDSLSAG